MEDIFNQLMASMGGYLPKIVGAVIILIGGWLLALILAAIVRGILRKAHISDTLSKLSDKEGGDVAVAFGKGVFWIVMIMTIIAVSQVLGLTLATDPLKHFLTEVAGYLPQLFGAAILLVAAWLVASIVRLIITRVLGAAKIDERVVKQGAGEGTRVSITKTIANAVYWLIFLLFLPAILGTLKLEGLLQPVQTMLDKFLGFLPNVLAAVVIGVVGWFVARIVQRIVTNLIAAANIDKYSEKLGMMPLSKMIGLVVYILILIPVLISALKALALDAITVPASSMLTLILEAIPSVFAAIVVVGIAYFIGKIVSGLITGLLGGVGFNKLFAHMGLGKDVTEGPHAPSIVVGYIIHATIMLFAVFEASDLLGFKLLSNLLANFTVFGGRILLGLVILGIAFYLANIVAKAINSSKAPSAGLLALIARIAIMLFGVSMGIREMGLANEIINMAFGLILGAIAIALAIAFGIGGRDIAARKLEEWAGTKKR